MSWRFEPVINVGNILTAFLILGTMVGGYISIREVQVRQEARLVAVEAQISVYRATSDRLIEQLGQIRVDIATIRALYQAQITQEGQHP